MASAVGEPFETQGMDFYKWIVEVSTGESAADETLVLLAERGDAECLPALTDALLSNGFTIDGDWRRTDRGFSAAVTACEMTVMPPWAESCRRSVQGDYAFIDIGDSWEGAKATYKRHLLGALPTDSASLALIQTDIFKDGAIKRSDISLDAQIDMPEMTARQARDIASQLLTAASLMESKA